MSAGLVARRLHESDALDRFCSGNEPLDNFLRQYAKQNQRRQLSGTWLAVEGERIAGYVTIVPGSIERALLDHVRPKLPPTPVPAVVLARMATDQQFLGRGVGGFLMRVVFREATDLAARLGCAGIYTDAKPATDQTRGADGFYARFGFVAVRPPSESRATTGMFLTLAKVEALIR